MSATLVGLPEGTPILCRACGGAASLDESLTVRCAYCGAHERLPEDALGRVMELKGRLALAAGRAAHAASMDIALARVFEDRTAWLRVTGVYLVFGILLSFGAVSELVHVAGIAGGAALVPAMARSLLTGPMILLTGCAAVALALAYGRGVYRRQVRPLLLARPPAFEGAPFACRACGGPLPGARGVEAPCPYCRTTNLIPRTEDAAQRDGLMREAEAQRALTHGASARSITLGAQVRNVFLGAWGLLVVCLLIVSAALS